MATTSTFSLRKLIQTKLNPDDDTTMEDTDSAYEDDLRNPIKRRLAAWLIPDQPEDDPCRGSASAVDIRNLSDFLPTQSPAPPTPPAAPLAAPILSNYSSNLLPHILSDAADDTITGTNSMDSATDANDGKTLPTLPGPSDMGSANVTQDNLYHQHDPDANHLSDQNIQQASAPITSGPRRLVRMPSFSSTFSSSSLDSDHHIPLQHHRDDQIVDERLNSDDCRTLAEDAQQPNPQSQMSMTFLFTPTPSHGSGPKDFMSLGARDELSTGSSKRDSTEWSDGVRQLMLETEQAFASGSTFDGLSSTFELHLPSISEPKDTLHSEEKLAGGLEEIGAHDDHPDRQRPSDEHQVHTNGQVEQEVENVRRATFSPLRAAPEPVSEPDTISETAGAPTQPPTSSLLAPDTPPHVSITAPSPTTYQGPGPVVLLPQVIWRKSGGEASTERRSMEQTNEVPGPIPAPAEEALDSDHRISRFETPPPLPPRRKSLSIAPENTALPPSATATSFNVTPAITQSQKAPAKVPQSSSKPPAKETNSTGQLAPPKYGPSGPRRPSKITRWGLSEGVADILTGHRFKKIEADEMLTSEQLLKLKKEREEIRRKEEMESSRAAEVKRLAELERQVEKSESENERSRSRDGLQKRNSDSSSLSLSSSYVQRPVSEERSPVPSKQRFSDDMGDLDDDMYKDDTTGLATVDLLGPSPRDSSIFQDGTPIPLPPASQPPTGALPPIPKGGSKRARQDRNGSKRQKPANSLRPEENDEFFYLKSTPYSLALPSYRHGRIAFAKSEMGRGALTMDDTLDWTAFQMAILGAGDIMPEVYDDEDTRLNEDVMAWFNSFGFDSHGHLVPESAPSPRSSSHSTISTAPTEASIPAPIIGESSSLWAYDTTQFFSSNGSKSWTMQGLPMEVIGHKRHDSTPPCSPMMPVLVGSEDDDEKIVVDAHHHDAFTGEKEVVNNDVQMGCNMTSDLGDFLKWEAQHAFGPGYYGAH